MKTLTLLSICALLSVSCSMGGFEPDVVVDLADDTAVDSDAADLADADVADPADLDDLDDQADPDDPDATPASPASDSSSDSSASDSNSSSDSTSSSESSESSSSESNSASDSSSSSSSSSSESVSEEVPTEPEPEPEVIMKRDLSAVLLRRRRAAPAGDLSPLQLESLREVCELNDGCDEMAETAGIVAAYVAYYGAVPF